MRNCTATTEDVVLTGKPEVGLPVVFGDTLKFVSRNTDPVFLDILGK
ncbi:hypothetical protein ACFFQF_27440 [Haladaptatus pallidirubidus]